MLAKAGMVILLIVISLVFFVGLPIAFTFWSEWSENWAYLRGKARAAQLNSALNAREDDGGLSRSGQRTWTRAIRAAARLQSRMDRQSRWKQARPGIRRMLAWFADDLLLLPRRNEKAAVLWRAQRQHSIEIRRALTASLTQHGLTPRDQAGLDDLVGFYALAGQAAQWRALDPDGSRLAFCYSRATAADQALLREALAREGDPEMIRRVAGRLAGTGSGWMNAADWGDMTARLAAHHDWPGLWKLAKELPVVPAAIAAAAIGESWQPDGQRDRELLALLASGDAAALNPARIVLNDLQDMPRMRALADKPQAEWRPADLAAALHAAPDVRRHPAAWPFHNLLLHCLEHRFGADVQLGPDTTPTGPDEISIARQDTRSPASPAG